MRGFLGATFLGLALGILVNLLGCGFCSHAENKSTARCKAQDVAVDCAAPTVIKVVESILPDVKAALLSGDYTNLLAIIQAKLQGQGFTDLWALVTCTINRIERAPAAGAEDSLIYQHGEEWKAAHPVRVK